MELEEILEKVTMDIVMEGIGLACSLAIVGGIFMGGGISSFIELFATALCGS